MFISKEDSPATSITRDLGWATWTPIAADKVRWTPIVPELIFPGYWVVMAEEKSLFLEGSYGVQTGGAPRTKDADGNGSGGDIGCEP